MKPRAKRVGLYNYGPYLVRGSKIPKQNVMSLNEESQKPRKEKAATNKQMLSMLLQIGVVRNLKNETKISALLQI